MRLKQSPRQFPQSDVRLGGYDLNQKHHTGRELPRCANGPPLQLRGDRPLVPKPSASLTAVLGLTPNTRAAARQEWPAAL